MQIVSTWSFGLQANRAAWPILEAAGSSLDAVEAACCHAEADESIDSVGRGGLPDGEGRVSLDASIMTSPSRHGAVCAVRQHLHVASLARHVMEHSPHTLLAGSGADAFATTRGFETEELLTDTALEAFRVRRPHRPATEGLPPSSHDTLGVLALDSHGTLAGACTSSGTAYKLPGRVGDAPIIGAGLYVDPSAGAATATGDGELIVGTCLSFLAVELLRLGYTAETAVSLALQRMVSSVSIGDEQQVGLIVLTRDGDWACGALRPAFRVATRSADAEQLLAPHVVMFG